MLSVVFGFAMMFPFRPGKSVFWVRGCTGKMMAGGWAVASILT